MILGITGTLGAGKTTIVKYLEGKGFRHFSVRNYLIQEIERRGMDVNRNSMVLVANDIRKKEGPCFILETLYDQAIEQGTDAIIESIRAPGEVDALKGKDDFYLVCVDADISLRYDRIKDRNSETDNVSFEEFVRSEQLEMQGDDPGKQNLSYCMAHADFSLRNENSLSNLYEQMDKILEYITKQKSGNIK